MKLQLPNLPCTLLTAVLIALPVGTAALAQTTATGTATAAPTVTPPQASQTAPARSTRPEQAIQRIRTEDAGSRIDEVRVGGETQSITVQPKTGASTAAYEVKPPDSAKGNAPSQSSGDTNGSRVWNVLKF